MRIRNRSDVVHLGHAKPALRSQRASLGVSEPWYCCADHQSDCEQLRCRSETHGLDLRRLSHPIAMCDTDVYCIIALSFSHTACDNLMGATPVSYTHLTLPTTPYV